MTYNLDFTTMQEMSLAPETEEDEILQNLYCMLSTAIGEVPCYREFGLDKSFLHAPTSISGTMMIAAISDAMTEFFPELHLENVEFKFDSDHPDAVGCTIEVNDDE